MAKQKETFSFDLKTFFVPAAIILAGLMIAGGIFLGPKNANPTGDSPGVKGEQTTPPPSQPEPSPQAPPANQTAETSIDNDAIMGNKNTARIAIVEFSDYECPFCKRFWSETLNKIKENYLTTGKAILVYRDLPLGFHDPAATREANAAECARKLGGDEIFYEFHDEIYKQTPGNGAGISEEKLIAIGADLGLDETELAECIQNDEFAEEIKNDMTDARKAGIQGTPGFVIGMLDNDGNVEGVLVKGAQPYSNFEQIIDQFLKG